MTRLLASIVWISLLLCVASLPGRTAATEWGDDLPLTRILRITTDGRSFAPEGLGWSPTGRHFAYYRRETPSQVQLMVRSEDGELVYAVGRLGSPSTASWSPDGTLIAYVFSESNSLDGEARVYVWSLETRESIEVARGFELWRFWSGYGASWYAGQVPVWSPDSRRFVCQLQLVRDPNSFRMGLWVFSVDGSPAVRLMPGHYDTTGNTYAASWSPDSQWLVSASCESVGSPLGLWISRPDGSGARRIVEVPRDALVKEPRWSPDGQWIAYGSTQGRPLDERGLFLTGAERPLYDIWIVRPDGLDGHPITHGTKDSMEGRMDFEHHRWSSDSRTICSVGSRLDALGLAHSGLYLMDVGTGGLTRIFANARESGEVVTNFEHAFDWNYSGTQILFTGRRHERHGEPGREQQLTDTSEVLVVYDVESQRLAILLEVRPEEDSHSLQLGYAMPSWSPDDRRLLFTDARVISLRPRKSEPDLYVMDLTSLAQTAPEATELLPSRASDKALGHRAATIILPVHRRASEIAEALAETHRGLWRLDAGLNALLISATDDGALAALKQDVALLDQPVPQVMVDVLVTELTDEASQQLGMDWEYVRGSFAVFTPLGLEGGAGEAIYRGVGNLDKSFYAALSALVERGEANIRADPRVLARCGTKATISIRRTDNFFYDAGTDYQGHPVRARSDISADIILRIEPHVLASGQIAMNVDATVDSFIFGGRDDLPDTTRRQVTTDVVCGDGESVVIGGLTQEEQTVKRQKTPVLGDLPFLGQLFRHTTHSTKESTLVIFITPHLIGSDSAR